MSDGGHVMSVREMIETLDVVTNHYDAVHRHNSWTDIARESIHVGTTHTTVYTFCLPDIA